MMHHRAFLSVAGVGGVGVLCNWRRVSMRVSADTSMSMRGAARRQKPSPPVHPTPRNGVTGAEVLTAAQLTMAAYLIPLFDGIRAIPAIADGIRCSCGGADLSWYYSLFS